MSIKSRLSKIQEQVDLINGYCVNDKYRKVVGMRSVTDQAANYHSTLRVTGKGKLADVEFVTVECECHKVTSPGIETCKGSQRTICRHCAAAFVWSNQQNGKQANLFDNFSDAFRYSNFGGKIVKLVSNGHEGWAVVRQQMRLIGPVDECSMPKDKINNRIVSTATPAPNDSFQDRVNLLRGEREMGIE